MYLLLLFILILLLLILTISFYMVILTLILLFRRSLLAKLLLQLLLLLLLLTRRRILLLLLVISLFLFLISIRSYIVEICGLIGDYISGVISDSFIFLLLGKILVIVRFNILFSISFLAISRKYV